MGRDWIIEVLADLRAFARDNDLPRLSLHLEEAQLLASIEIEARKSGPASYPAAGADDRDDDKADKLRGPGE